LKTNRRKSAQRKLKFADAKLNVIEKEQEKLHKRNYAIDKRKNKKEEKTKKMNWITL